LTIINVHAIIAFMANKNKMPIVSEKAIFEDDRKARAGTRVGRLLERQRLSNAGYEKVRKGQEAPREQIIEFTNQWRQEAGSKDKPFDRVKLKAPSSSKHGTPRVVVEGITHDVRSPHDNLAQDVDQTDWFVSIGEGKTNARFAVRIEEFGIFQPVDVEPVDRAGRSHPLSGYSAREQVQAFETVARAFDTINQAQAEDTLIVSNPMPRTTVLSS
jgi:hypothetical protein